MTLKIHDTTVALLPAGAERTPAWHAARREGIGASDMGAILGLSAYQSAFGLYWEKVSSPEEWPGVEDNLAMRFGREDEEGIAKLFAERFRGWTVYVPPGALWKSTRQPSWMRATPDRLITLEHGMVEFDDLYHMHGERAEVTMAYAQSLVIPLEIKSVSSSKGWGKDGTDEIPLTYAVQLLQQCLVFDAPFGVLAARLGKQLRVYVLHTYDHHDLLDEMRAAGEKFWEHVTHKIEPMVDGHEATEAALKQIYPGHAEDEWDPPVLLSWSLLNDAARLRAKVKKATADLDAVKNQIREQLGNANVGIDLHGTEVVKRTIYERREYTVRAGVVDRIDFKQLPEE